MAILSPTSLETVELGGTGWRAIYNQNFSDLNDVPKHLFRWYVDGSLEDSSFPGNEVDGVWIAPTTLEMIKAYIYGKTPGSSSSTIVDINKNGTTIFTTQGNRPTLAYDDGDKKAVTVAPDVTALADGDILSIDFDQIAPGAEDFTIILICR
jgi:hypothetical protein